MHIDYGNSTARQWSTKKSKKNDRGDTEIRSPLKEFASAEQSDDFSLDHGADDFTVSKTEPKTLDAEGFSVMFCSGDLALRDSELITLERLNFNRIVAIAILIMRGKCTYRGQDNSDTYITKAMPRNIEGGWKSALLQR